MALLPVPNVGSQIERAVIAYLKESFDLPGSFDAANIARPNFYFSNDGNDRQAPLIDVLADSSSEVPTFSNDEDYNVRIKAEWPAGNQPGQTNPGWNWVQINNFIGVPVAAMSQTTTGQDRQATADAITAAGRALAVDASGGADPVKARDAANNADMVNFTCLKVMSRGSRRAQNVNGALYFFEVRNFLISACPSNRD